MTGDWESAAAARDLKNAMDADPAQLVILPDPTIRLMPFVLALMAMIWVGLASFIPDIPILGRIAAVAQYRFPHEHVSHHGPATGRR